MRTLMIAAAMLSFSAAVPAFAQDAMASHDQMSSGEHKMTAAETRKAKTCSAISHDKMVKNAGCAKLMKAHPAMMSHDAMMSTGH